MPALKIPAVFQPALTPKPEAPAAPQEDLSPEAFKQKIVAKHPGGVASDGTPYASMEAGDLVQRVVDKYPDGTTADGHKYSDYLPKAAPAAPVKKTNGLIELAKGVGKGVLSTVSGLSSVGETVANQTAGRLVSAATGKGLVPLPGSQLGESLSNTDSATGKKTAELEKTHNLAQNVGYYGEKVAEIAAPTSIVKNTILKAPLAARAAARTLADAVEVVAPKETAAVVKQAIKSGQGAVSGFLKRETLTPDQLTQKAAEAVQGIVKSTNTASQNANAVRNAITKTATDLVSKLKGMEIQPTLQPEELNTLFKSAVSKVEANHYLPEGSAKTAKNIFNDFMSFLPKAKEITAEDILAARKKLDASIQAMKGSNVFDPTKENVVSIALREIRQGANALVAKKAPNVEVEELLGKQSAMYDALENIASKAKGELGTTGPGRFLTRHPVLKTGLIKAAEGIGLGGAITAGQHFLGGK